MSIPRLNEKQDRACFDSSTGFCPVEDSEECEIIKAPSIEDKYQFLIALKEVINDWKKGLYQVRGFSLSENRGVVLSPCERKITNYASIQNLAKSNEAAASLLGVFKDTFRFVVFAMESIHKYVLLDSVDVDSLQKIEKLFETATTNFTFLQKTLKLHYNCCFKEDKSVDHETITTTVMPYFNNMIAFAKEALNVYKDVFQIKYSSLKI
jgi:hypothetical protein